MHLRRFREADRLASEPFDSSPQRQMLALDFLRVTFARRVLFRVEMTRVGTPLVGVVMGQAEGLQQLFEFEKNLVFTAAKDIR